LSEQSLRERIEQLVGSGASDFEISKEFKSYIKSYLDSLDEIFEADFGREFLYRHTKELDSILVEMFRYILRDSFGDYQPLINSIPVSMIALGSYGRQQLSVYSDIDIMLLYKEIKGYQLKPILERFLYMAWDAGLKIGHRVHEVSEITESVKTDITIKTAILESRFIWGSRFLWVEYQNKLSQIRRTEQKEFVFAKLEEMAKRHKKYKLSMEPNIKEGVGGLRDSNTLFWLATCIYGVSASKELTGKLFSEAEYKEYRIALEFLFKLRNALHLLAGKKQDELLMQTQREVALKLGFKDMKSQKAQNALMSKTLRSMQAINFFSSVNCAKLTRKITYQKDSIAKLRKEYVGDGFFCVEGKLFCSFSKKSSSLYTAIRLLVDVQKECGGSFDYSIHQFIKNSAEEKKQKKISKELLTSLLSETSYNILFALYEAGVITKLFAPFEKIMFLAQFDGYHAYPVDIHTLEAVRHLENIKDGFVKSVFESFDAEDKAYLKLAILFHDIGKGRGGNHSAIGARIFSSFASKLGLDEQKAESVRRVILYHTLMSNTAFREDLNSEKTILSFAGSLKSKKAIDYLFVLTYADLQAVGQNIYSSFNATLLRELYYKSTGKLSRSELVSEAATRLTKEAALLKSEEFKALPQILQKNIISVASNLFFIKFSSAKIIDICKRAKECEEFSFSLSNEPYFSFEIISKKWINFGRLLSRFAFLDIVSMDIFKLFDNAKYFRVSFSSTIDESELVAVGEIINSFAASEEKVASGKRPIIKKTDISFDFEHSETYAKMLLTTKNQQGLLAFIIEVFDELGVDIATAKVGTIKNVAKDMFLIEKSSGIEKKQKEVIKRLVGSGESK
jgi:[protein-PII] uridylyltransferase